jgi:hypothetical protein
VLFYKNNRKRFPMFTLSYANTRASLGEREQRTFENKRADFYRGQFLLGHHV